MRATDVSPPPKKSWPRPLRAVDRRRPHSTLAGERGEGAGPLAAPATCREAPRGAPPARPGPGPRGQMAGPAPAYTPNLAARPLTVRNWLRRRRRRGLPETACSVPGGKFVPYRGGSKGKAWAPVGGGGKRLRGALRCLSLPRSVGPSLRAASGRRAPARCALSPARSGSSPDAPPPPPPRVRQLHFLFL